MLPDLIQLDDQNFYEDVFDIEDSTWCDNCPGGNKQDPWTGKEINYLFSRRSLINLLINYIFQESVMAAVEQHAVNVILR